MTISDDLIAEIPNVEIQLHVDRYQVLSVLGSGGMGIVYKAFDPKLSRYIALKLHRDDGATSRDQRRMLREAQALAQLSHPNVVAAHDVGTHEGAIFVAMEIADGLPLNKWLTKNRTHKEIMQVLIGAGRGLAAAHAAGVLHRDHNPSNVVVSPDGQARIIDFGLARSLDSIPDTIDPDAPKATSGPHREATPPPPVHTSPPPSNGTGELESGTFQQTFTSVGEIMGTPGYVSPEHFSGDIVDARADQFSFAATAYFALAGTTRFPAKDMREYSEVWKKSTVQTEWPIQSQRHVPRRIRRIIERGLEKEPEDRFPDVASMVDALENSKSKWSIGIAAMLILAVASGLFVLMGKSRAGNPVCQLDSEPFAPMWSKQRQDTIRNAFVETKQPGALNSMALLNERFSEYAGEWQAMKLQACEETYVRGNQTEALYDLRNTCLEQKRQQLGVLLELLENADAALVNRASNLIPNLGLRECADVQELLGQTRRLPKAPSLREKIAHNEANLRKAEAFSLAGKSAKALELAQETLVAATEVNYPQTIVRAKLKLGTLLQFSGRLPEAIEHIKEAIPLAARNHLDRELGWLMMRHLEYLANTARYPAALEVALAVQAHMLRFSPPPELQAGVLFMTARLQVTANRFSEAEKGLLHAVAILEREKVYTRIPTVLNTLSITYMQQRKFDESQSALTNATDIYRRYVGPDHPNIVYSRLQAFDLEIMRKNFAAAKSALVHVEELFKMQGEPTATSSEVFLRRGVYAENTNHCEQAIQHYHDTIGALQQLQGANTPAISIPLARIGICYSKLAKVRQAITNLERAVSLFSDHDLAFDVGEALFTLAQMRVQLDAKSQQAVSEAKRARELWSKLGVPFLEDVAAIDAWLAEQ